MRFEFSDHALEDDVLEGKHGRRIYQKIIGKYMIGVIVEGSTIVTVYRTSRIERYRR